jgi:hypothetical protein
MNLCSSPPVILREAKRSRRIHAAVNEQAPLDFASCDFAQDDTRGMTKEIFSPHPTTLAFSPVNQAVIREVEQGQATKSSHVIDMNLPAGSPFDKHKARTVGGQERA